MRKNVFYIRSSSFNKETGGIDYGEPQRYIGSVMPEYNQMSIQMYGERVRQMLTCSLRKGYAKNIKDGDLAYIYVEQPIQESVIGEKADYVVKSVLVGNQFTVVKFEKIHKEV